MEECRFTDSTIAPTSSHHAGSNTKVNNAVKRGHRGKQTNTSYDAGCYQTSRKRTSRRLGLCESAVAIANRERVSEPDTSGDRVTTSCATKRNLARWVQMDKCRICGIQIHNACLMSEH